ncbi:hypothetical protein [Phytomonospora endophytica]|uniref:Uncharacterized protein n=1 Tax=Phytomonospora endophytica TaxID=714109 RepID=A0A841FL57_9ACTN|nr:hypothetical protein [Phytomonospora endophytica]MBB6036594.1 hypothetical protein [Phytomonospora endophytica]GIG65915.1 hypothetical protein Pen01_22100 [Phytomonospora endophytica]
MDGRWSSDRPDMPQRVRALAGRMASRTRSPRAVMVVVGLIAVVLVSAIAVSMARTSNPGQAATAGDPVPPTVAPTSVSPDEPVVTTPPSPSGSPSKSPSKSAKPGTAGEAPEDPPGGGSGDSGGSDDGDGAEAPPPAPKKTNPPTTSTASRPEAFGAWWASEGKYTAKWERPADDGGLTITGYVVKKCSGETLKNVGSGTFRVDINHPSLTCVTVQAINAKGAGQTAYFDGIK